MNMKRMRGRGGNRQGSGGSGGGGPYRQSGGGGGGGGGGHQPMNRNHIFDSNGPDMRLRGTAQQLFEKYLQLGRDATGASDRVMAESYFQHAEHYFRILNAMSQVTQQQGGQPYPPQRRYQGQDQEGSEHGQTEQGESGAAAIQSTPYAHQNGNGQERAQDRSQDRAQDRAQDRDQDRDRDRDRDRDDAGLDQRDERDD